MKIRNFIILLNLLFISQISHAHQIARVSFLVNSNFSERGGESGQEVCRIDFPEKNICYPFFNIGKSSIIINVDGIIKNAEITQELGEAFMDERLPNDSANFVVTNKLENKVIFNGRVDNKIGLICTESSCKAWE
ncbi:hypothetical protein [Parashewanella tropica]|uniref:hypothetical protein n=1 Tax=Parashewanella tropica TaxID=2547970 RepID=UPI0010594E49|nr:hypothetical protein [Parashewanella tropica]